MRLEITIDASKVVEIVNRLQKIPGGLQRAAKSALNRTVRGGKQDASRKIKERYVSDLASRTLKTRVVGLTGEIKSAGSRNPLEKFKINPRVRINPGPPGGIYAQVVKGQGGNIRRAFIQTKGGVYERVGKARLPIKRIKSLAAPQMLSAPPVSNFVLSKIEERFEKNFVHEANAVIGGYL